MYEGNYMKQQQVWLCCTLCWCEFSFAVHCYHAQDLAPQAQRSMRLQKSCDYLCEKPAICRNEQAMPVLPAEEMLSGGEPHVVLLPIVKAIIFLWLLAPDRVVSHPYHCFMHNSPFHPDINVSCQNKYRYKNQMAWNHRCLSLSAACCRDSFRLHPGSPARQEDKSRARKQQSGSTNRPDYNKGGKTQKDFRVGVWQYERGGKSSGTSPKQVRHFTWDCALC